MREVNADENGDVYVNGEYEFNLYNKQDRIVEFVQEQINREDKLTELLEEAVRGLKWYVSEYPNSASGADDEFFERVNKVISQ